MAAYFMLHCIAPLEWEDRALLRATPLPPGELSWRSGLSFKTAPSVPIEIEMQASHSDDMIQYNHVDALIMTKAFQASLSEVGVNNLDVYETIIRHPRTGFVTRDYVACNLIGGLVSAVNIDKSNVVGGSKDHRLDTDFDGLLIDEERTQGLLMFRLAENTSAIVVHESVRKHLEFRGFDQLIFINPEDWVG
ncbi:hypothetical protein LEP1GSC041_1660 [Leptospira noguchii str. 2006001870]|uniref:hypothetical protein n=1 Tax=Leptospira noguchii TaxID=28182 RepID=UPI000248A70E|nr:hypothetical protein [Leptospira noguchii]EKR71286.1 hypothetical protein LEP1GSC041_1660 [Leptospira noguchii str. 2006001870]